MLGSGASATFRLCPECAVCLFAFPKESEDDDTTVYESAICFSACTVHDTVSDAATVFFVLLILFNSCW
jgi:hypothetical protein